MGDTPIPDAALLAVCDQLRAQQAEWQRLWTLTSDGPDNLAPADHEWTTYNRKVWPGMDQEAGEGPAGQLLDLHPVTPEGLAAKAAAICAMDETSQYTRDCRDDACRLWESVVLDTAGATYAPLGEAAGA